MDFATILQYAKDLAVIVASCVAIYVGLAGLKTWRRQIKGTVEYELAKKTLHSVYSVRNAIGVVRNPFMMLPDNHEIPGEAAEGVSKRKKDWMARCQEYERRWDHVREALSRLNVALLESEIVWGREIKESVQPLIVCVNELYAHLWEYLDSTNPESEYRPEKERRQQLRDAVYEKATRGESPFSNKLQVAVESVEAVLRSHINAFHSGRGAK